MENPEFAVKKKVDESWKESVAKESAKTQTQVPSQASAQNGPPEVSFEFFISSLGAQAIQVLNEGKVEQARYLIDTIQMLVEKTQGNLSLEETQGAQELLYQLQLEFVKKSQAT